MKKKVRYISFLLSGFLLVSSLFAQDPGDLDPTFADDGKLILDWFGFEEEVYDMVIKDNDKILLAGLIRYPSTGNYDLLVVQLNSDGSNDVGFGALGFAAVDLEGDQYGKCIALQGDKIIVGGRSYFDGEDQGIIVRLNEDGSLDESFSGDGVWYDDEFTSVTDLVIDSDDKIVFCGEDRQSALEIEAGISRLHSYGSRDFSFNSTGINMVAIEEFQKLYSIHLSGDGKIYAGGEIQYTYEESKFLIVCLHNDGQNNLGFSSDGIVSQTILGVSDVCRAITVQDDGKILAAGSVIQPSNDQLDMTLIRLNTNGTLDYSFDDDGYVVYSHIDTDDIARDLKIQADNKIVIAGTRDFLYEVKMDFMLLRYFNNGSIDTDFGDDGLVTTTFYEEEAYDYCNAIGIQSDYKILAAGHVYTGADLDIAAARYISGLYVDIPENGVNDYIYTYPNPVKNRLTITSGMIDSKYVKIKICDLHGKTVYDEVTNISDGQATIDQFNLGNGVYVLHVHTKNKKYSQKILIRQ